MNILDSASNRRRKERRKKYDKYSKIRESRIDKMGIIAKYERLIMQAISSRKANRIGKCDSRNCHLYREAKQQAQLCKNSTLIEEITLLVKECLKRTNYRIEIKELMSKCKEVEEILNNG
jgi:hypothetical protein